MINRVVRFCTPFWQKNRMTKDSNKNKPWKNRNRKAGLSPGTLVYVGKNQEGLSTIHCTRYDESQAHTIRLDSAGEINDLVDPDKVNWFNITGIHNTSVVDRIGKEFGIHPLVMEDILNTSQRPKIEIYDSYIFVSLKVVYPNDGQIQTLQEEQISFILTEDCLLSFQEIDSDYFQPIRERIDRSGSRIRSKNTDYLLFALIDLVVDHYLSLIEHIGDDIQTLEDKIFNQPEREHLSMVMTNKRNLLHLHKIITPIRESLLKIKSTNTSLIDPGNKIFFEDVHDHLASVKESLDLYFELNKSLRESYMSSIGFKTNEVMKLLTIISTLFIPLTFIVGVYGMNFSHMPELSWPHGYFYIWGLMILITILLIIYFKKRKWL